NRPVCADDVRLAQFADVGAVVGVVAGVGDRSHLAAGDEGEDRDERDAEARGRHEWSRERSIEVRVSRRPRPVRAGDAQSQRLLEHTRGPGWLTLDRAHGTTVTASPAIVPPPSPAMNLLRPLSALLLSLPSVATLCAQSNTVPGRDLMLIDTWAFGQFQRAG